MADYETDGSGALSLGAYDNMERSDIKPDFNVIEGGGKGDGKPTGNLRAVAKNELAGAEQAATSPISTINRGMNDAKAAEQNQPIRNNVLGKNQGGEKNDKKKGFIKGKGPMAFIFSLLLGAGALAGGSQSLMPFATASRIIEEFNSTKTIMSTRSDRMLRYQLDTERYKSPTRKTIFGRDKFVISSKQTAKLKAEGIDVIEVDVDGNKIKLLVFDDGTGAKQPILTKTDMDRIDSGKIDAEKFRAEVKSKYSSDVEFKNIGTRVDNALSTIEGFRNGYLSASKTWKGNVSGWFDSLVLKIFDRLNISRSRFKTWKTASDIEAGNAKFKEAATNNKKVSDSKSSGTKEDEVFDKEKDKFVNETNKVSGEADDDSILNKKTKVEVEEGLTTKITKVAQAGSSLICAAFAAVGSIHGIVAAAQAAEILNVVTGYLEAVQKVQAGDGDGSPMAYYTNGLTKVDSDGTSGMSSHGMGLLFGSKSVLTSDPSVQATSSESLMTKIRLFGTSIEYTAQAFQNCAYAKLAGSIAGIVVDIVGVFTFGIGSLFKGLAKSIAYSAITGILLPLAAEFIIPFAADMIMKNYISDFIGEDLGNAIMSGANKYLGGNHQGGGGSPGDAGTVLAYHRETQRILAEEAEHERQTKSPFDVTSRNTFFGSIAYNLMSFSTVSASSSSIFSHIGNLLGSSVVSLLPSANAVAETELVTAQGDCPLLESIGIMGDVYCNPYYTSDLSTIDADPGDIFEIVARRRTSSKVLSSSLNPDDLEICVNSRDKNGKPISWGYSYSNNFKYLMENSDDPEGCILDVKLDTSENPVIEINSNLGQYIAFCGQRSSPWGLADSAIASQMNKFDIEADGTVVNGLLNGIVGAIPFVGDLQEALETAADAENVNWVSGAACVATSGSATNANGETIQNVDWDENKYYQRYMEDQRWLESVGLISESSVTVALNDYYKENPLDDSYEGILARFSGMSKEEVIATLDIMDGLEFMANYDPKHLYPVPSEETSESAIGQFSNMIIADHFGGIIPEHVVYVDIRSRSFAV